MNQNEKDQDAQGQQAQELASAEAQAEAEFGAAFAEAAGGADSEEGTGTGAEEDEAGQGEGKQGQKSEAKSAEATGDAQTVEGAEPQATDDVEALRRKAQLFDAEQGRLRQTQQRLRQLEEELAAQRSAVRVEAVGKPLAELPEEIREDVEAFAKANPEYAAFAVEDSKDGERLRMLLAEYGPGHVQVTVEADRIADKRERLAAKAAELTQAKDSVREAHFQTIYAAHPDFGALQQADLSVEENKAKKALFHARLDAWAEAKLGPEYVEIQRIRNEGTPQEVIGLLSRFKEETGPKAHQDRVRGAAEAAMAPRSKTSPTPIPKEDRTGSFKEGWDGAK